MNDERFESDIENKLRQARATAPVELRRRVLTKVAHELSARRGRNWNWLSSAAATVLVVISVAANAQVIRSNEQDLDDCLGPPIVSRRIREWSESVASVTDPATAKKLESQLDERLRQAHAVRTWTQLEAINQLLRETALHDRPSTTSGRRT